jgi:E3 ubiquitin-protein ligase DOA10
VLPAAMTNVAREQSVGAAVDFGVLRTAALSTDYFVALVLAVVVSVVLGAIAGVLAIFVVGIFVSFYVQVVTFYLVGRGFGEALDTRGNGPAVASGDADTAA